MDLQTRLLFFHLILFIFFNKITFKSLIDFIDFHKGIVCSM